MEPSTKDVLAAFAAEPNIGKDALLRYLDRYPHLADELTHLCWGIVCAPHGELSQDDIEQIGAALKRRRLAGLLGCKRDPGPVTHFTTPPELGDGQHGDAWPAHPALFPGFDLAGAIEIWLQEHANPGDTVTITARGGEMPEEER